MGIEEFTLTAEAYDRLVKNTVRQVFAITRHSL